MVFPLCTTHFSFKLEGADAADPVRPAIKSQGGKLKKIEKKDLEEFGHDATKVP